MKTKIRHGHIEKILAFPNPSFFGISILRFCLFIYKTNYWAVPLLTPPKTNGWIPKMMVLEKVTPALNMAFFRNHFVRFLEKTWPEACST